MARVTGIGGVFFKSKGDPKVLAAWYQTHLGIELKPFGGAVFKWSQDPGAATGATAWMLGKHDTQWFSPSESSFMINYRVDDLTALIAHLQQSGVKIVQGPETHDNGKFAWIMDPDGNKVELWEPKVS